MATLSKTSTRAGRRRQIAAAWSLIAVSTSAASLTIFTRTAEAQTSTGYVPLTPARILDTRTNVGAPGPVGPGGSITVDVTGVGGVPESGVGAVVLNVTATNPTEPTYVTVWPPSGQARPEASNLNVVAGESVPNLVIATVGPGGTVEMFNFAGSVDLVADVTGWLPAAVPFTQYTALTPARILDSRSLLGAGGWVGEGGQITVDVTGVGGVPETGVAAVVLNVTATNPTEPTYVTVWPTGQPRPEASNLNVVAGESRPNLVIARVGDGGTVDMYNFNGQVDLVADVAGWFPASADYIGLTPSRVLDTRSNAGAAGPVQPGGSITVDVTGVGGVPETGVGAVVLNVTATNPTEPTFVTVWPSGQARPEASNLNVMAGESVPNLVIATVGAGGTIEMFNYAGSLDLVADVAGWFPAPSGPPEPPAPPGPGDPQPPAGARVEMKVLVVDDGSGFGASSIGDRLRREGVPVEVVNLTDPGRPLLTADFLSSTVNGQRRARFNGVVMPNEQPNALPLAELEALHAFENEFAIRQVDAFVTPSPAIGLNATQWSGVLDGNTATLTTAGRDGAFKYMAGPLPFEDLSTTIDESYGFLSSPALGAAFTPLLTASIPGTPSTGSLIGVLHTGNREEMVLTFAFNEFQPKFQFLGHGIVSWLTKGAYAGLSRNYFSVHIDDIFLPDDRWHTVDNCTYGDGCPPTSTPIPQIRMVPADVDHLIAWQAANGVKLDMTFNGFGSVEALQDGIDAGLTQKFLDEKSQFRWLDHTYEHLYLGCAAAPDGTCQTAVSQSVIHNEISSNIAWAAANGIAIDAGELVTGEHSGLRSPPQLVEDNPNLAPALAANGIQWVAADNSRDSAQRQVGSALTVPRFPMNIFYNVATKTEEIDEYNWIYMAPPNGICVPSGTNTCLTAPLVAPGDFDNVLVPLEAGIALTHMMSNNPRPHYAHQSNITEDRILYPVLDRMLNDYRAVFAGNTPVANPTMAQSGTIIRRQALWEAAVQSGGVESYVQSGHLIVINRTGGNLDVPVTAPNGSTAAGSAFGESYAGERSAFQTLAPGASITVVLP